MYTKEEIEKWESICQRAAGLCAELFKPKEILIIQDFIVTGRADLLKETEQSNAQVSGGTPSAVIVRLGNHNEKNMIITTQITKTIGGEGTFTWPPGVEIEFENGEVYCATGARDAEGISIYYNPEGTGACGSPCHQALLAAGLLPNAGGEGRELCERTSPPPCSASDVSAKYHELLFAVARRSPGESRHETALRYIRETERRVGEAGSCMQNNKPHRCDDQREAHTRGGSGSP